MNIFTVTFLVSDVLKVVYVISRYYLLKDQFEKTGTYALPLTVGAAFIKFFWLLSLNMENVVSVYIFYYLVSDSYEKREEIFIEDTLATVVNAEGKTSAEAFLD